MVPRGPPIVRGSFIFREYAMFCLGHFVSQAVGEQTVSYGMDEPTAIEVIINLKYLLQLYCIHAFFFHVIGC